MNRALTLFLCAALGSMPLASAQAGFASPASTQAVTSASITSNSVPVTASTTGPVVFDMSRVYVNPDLGRLSGFLNTSTDWQLIQVPIEGVDLAALQGVSLRVAGLPDGLTISVARAMQAGQFLLLNVEVNRSFGNAVPDGVADVTVLSGTTALAHFQVQVQYVPYL